jgi:hypothetical protein
VNHKRRRPKHQRAGCLMCKPHKDERAAKASHGGNARRLMATAMDMEETMANVVDQDLEQKIEEDEERDVLRRFNIRSYSDPFREEPLLPAPRHSIQSPGRRIKDQGVRVVR